MRDCRRNGGFNEVRPRVFAFHVLLPFTIIMLPKRSECLRFI